MIWGCPSLRDSTDPAIVKSESLLLRALREHEEVPCLWYRGMTPLWWNVPPLPVQEEVWEVGDVADLGGNDFFLDGAGGKRSSDWRLRRIGWAWIQLPPCEIPTEDPLGDHGWHYPAHCHDCTGQYGTMAGEQTVPRAEHYALLKLLLHLK